MSDRFFTQKYCDRCGKSLDGGRIMSMFNEDCICMECSEAEQKRADFKEANQADIEQIKKGNFNFKGIGYRK